MSTTTPIARFDPVNGVSGAIEVLKLPEVVTPPDGDAFFQHVYNARPDIFQDNAGPEINIKLANPLAEMWEYRKFTLPENFKVRRGMYFEVSAEDFEAAKSWQQGQPLQAENGKLCSFYQLAPRTRKQNRYDYAIAVVDYGGHDNSYEHQNITNLATGQSVHAGDAAFTPNNNKFSIFWADTENKVGYKSGYNTGRPFNLEYFADPEGTGSARIKFTASGHGAHRNELEGQEEKPILFDVADRGKVHGIVVMRKRPSGPDIDDGEIGVYKCVDGGEWQHIFNVKVNGYVDPNQFDIGYLWGWSNAGFEEETRIKIWEYAIYDERPAFLDGETAPAVEPPAPDPVEPEPVEPELREPVLGSGSATVVLNDLPEGKYLATVLVEVLPDEVA